MYTYMFWKQSTIYTHVVLYWFFKCLNIVVQSFSESTLNNFQIFENIKPIVRISVELKTNVIPTYLIIIFLTLLFPENTFGGKY